MKTLLPLSALLLAGLPASLAAHGTMEVPINRTYACFKEGAETPKSAACKEAHRVGGSQALYDWNGINQNPPGDNHQRVVPDGQLCGGGQELFKGFNLPRADWQASNIVPDARGNFEFLYKATAPHATKYFLFYVTKNGWNPAQPLKWSDLELFGTYNGNPLLDAQRRYRMDMKLPANKTGRHIIFNVWKRSDSEEAFYSCSDVNFAGGTVKPEPPPMANPWREAGNLIARENLPEKSNVTLRVFDARGQDAERHVVTLNATSGQMANWPYELALKVNSSSQIARIGVISSQQRTVSITPQRGAAANRVFLNEGYAGYSYAVDIEKGSSVTPPPTRPTPPTPPVPPVSGTPWSEGPAYKRDQIVVFQGKRYRCLQSHTAWKGAGWTPASQPALWTLVK